MSTTYHTLQIIRQDNGTVHLNCLDAPVAAWDTLARELGDRWNAPFSHNMTNRHFGQCAICRYTSVYPAESRVNRVLAR